MPLAGRGELGIPGAFPLKSCPTVVSATPRAASIDAILVCPSAPVDADAGMIAEMRKAPAIRRDRICRKSILSFMVFLGGPKYEPIKNWASLVKKFP